MNHASKRTFEPDGIRAVITDWAGTIVDYGSLAPASVVMEVFSSEGVPITLSEARAPMGRAKRDHLATIAAMPRVAKCWTSIKGVAPAPADIDRLYARFLPLQIQVLAELSHAIPGVAVTLVRLRSRGLRIGSTTGYTRELMSVAAGIAGQEGVEVDVVVTADDVAAGRPAPWMIFRAAELVGVYPMSAVVVVDDTPVGIEAARNAGAWAVAVARTGNALGLSEAAALAMELEEWTVRRKQIETDFYSAGAHCVIDSFADLSGILGAVR